MFEKFDSGLKNVSERIKNTFELLDSIQNKAISAVDIYSKINNKLRTDVDRLYLVIQQCYDECTSYLSASNVDIDGIEAIPDIFRNTIKLKIYPFWRSFQHSVNKTLEKYKKYLPKLDKDIVNRSNTFAIIFCLSIRNLLPLEELQIAIQMDVDELLNIFDSMLKSVNKEGEDS
jgi:hypothetical protein